MEETLVLKNLETALEEAKIIPLWGNPPSFPLKAFAEEVGKVLDGEKVSFSIERTDWLTPEDFFQGFGEDPTVVPFLLSPLPGEFFLLFSKTSSRQLPALLSSDQKGFSDPALQEGFLKFLYLNILDAFNTLNPYGNLSATLASPCPLPEEEALSYDLSIHAGDKTLNARLLCPKDTRSSFTSFFQTHKPSPLTDPNASSLPIPLHIEVGKTQIKANEWSQAKVGDFLLLDRCSYDIEAKKGRGTLVLGHTPLFDVRLKEGEVKLLEHAMLYEETMNYEDQPNESDNFAEMEEDKEEAPLWSPGEENGETLKKASQVPLNLTVEVGRFQMPLEKVAQLKPGNILELGLGSDPHVYLTIGGKRVASGELVRLGEALGVKILKMGE